MITYRINHIIRHAYTKGMPEKAFELNSKLMSSTEIDAIDLSAILQRGLKLHQHGELEQAENDYRKILHAKPGHADALHLLGVICHQRQDNTTAIDLISRAIDVIPHQPIYHANLGNALRDSGHYQRAIDSYYKALQFKPDLVEIHINLGIALHQLAEFERAETAYRQAITLKPDSVEAHYNLGNTLKEQQRFNDAITCYRQALRINPNFLEAHYNLANVLEKQGCYDDAIDCLNQCLRIHPQWAEAYNNLGNLVKRQGAYEQAFSHYQMAVKLKPGLYAAQNNLGNALKDQGYYPEAIACYQKSLQAHPQYAEAHLNLGICLAELDRPAEAVDHFHEATRIHPEFAEAHNYMGLTLAEMGKRDAAIDCFKKAIEINQAYTEAYSYLMYELQYACDWQQLQIYLQRFDRLRRQDTRDHLMLAEPPFLQMARQSDPLQQLDNARLWCRKCAQPLPNSTLGFSFESRRQKTGKLTVGYLSGDFHDHATAHLMRSLFGLHDRDKFNICTYSYGPNDHSVYRKQICEQSDQFVDIHMWSHIDAASRIYDDGVDILVDLKGHTKGARLGILAHRPAPVQVHYLGYPGTTGADFIDYLISDRIVTPIEQSSFYSECLVFMPSSYQVNDHHQKIAARIWTKKELGLPETGCVFSSFNLPYKIDPLMFDCWMRILKQVPDSVLWLFKGGETTTHNLQHQACIRGVDPCRLVFGEKLPKAEHLARLQLSDLTLDTRIVNGHTTTSDSLWAGVPVITLMGDQFATRVSASLLGAVGLSDLVVDDLDAYEQLAVRLGSQHTERQSIKMQLSANRLTTPLFDTPEFIGHLETAYQKMWSIFREGRAPRQIEIVAD